MPNYREKKEATKTEIEMRDLVQAYRKVLNSRAADLIIDLLVEKWERRRLNSYELRILLAYMENFMLSAWRERDALLSVRSSHEPPAE